MICPKCKLNSDAGKLPEYALICQHCGYNNTPQPSKGDEENADEGV